MTYPRDDLRAAFETRLAAAIPSVPIKFENVKLTQPKTLYASSYLMFTSSTRASIGSIRRFDRHEGFFIVDIYNPEDQGSKALLDTAGAIETAFNAQEFTLPGSGYVVCLITKIVNGPMSAGFLAKSVMIPFYLDACQP